MRLRLFGLAALLASLFLPAIAVGDGLTGLEVLLRGSTYAWQQIQSPASLRSVVLAALSLLAMSANVALPLLAWCPGQWRPGQWLRYAAPGFAVVSVGLMAYLWLATPLNFAPGALVWIAGIAALAVAAWPVSR